MTGAVLVSAELSGGPGHIRRWFCVSSEEDDLVAACEACIRDLRAVIDDMRAAPAGS